MQKRTRIVSHGNTVFTGIYKQISDYIDSRTYKLVYLAYQKGATQGDVARALGVTDAVISRKFPRKKEVKE